MGSGRLGGFAPQDLLCHHIDAPPNAPTNVPLCVLKLAQARLKGSDLKNKRANTDMNVSSDSLFSVIP